MFIVWRMIFAVNVWVWWGRYIVLPLPFHRERKREKKSFFIFMEILAVESHHQEAVINEMLFLMFSHLQNSTKENRERSFNMWCLLFNAVFFYLILCILLLSFLIIFGWFSFTHTLMRRFESIFLPTTLGCWHYKLKI